MGPCLNGEEQGVTCILFPQQQGVKSSSCPGCLVRGADTEQRTVGAAPLLQELTSAGTLSAYGLTVTRLGTELTVLSNAKDLRASPDYRTSEMPLCLLERRPQSLRRREHSVRTHRMLSGTVSLKQRHPARVTSVPLWTLTTVKIGC